MRQSVLWTIIYIVLGVLFIKAAISSAHTTIWNWETILFALIAAFDFIVAIHHLSTRRVKQK